MSKSVLVTGGAGYIGSHVVAQLLEAGYSVTVLDNLYSGHRWAIPSSVEWVESSVQDSARVSEILSRGKIRSVLHFAAHIEVPESVSHPMKYYENNTQGTLQLLKACQATSVENLIFSSTAAVYGEPKELPVSETTLPAPLNPYGWSKLFSEQMIRDLTHAHPTLRAVILRYFNVAGARGDGTLGQATPRATHLIKVACETVLGKRNEIQVFGTDYPTADGTCIRDYIHVDDLAQAHLLALAYLEQGGKNELFNCGYGHGFSVREVLNTVEKVSGKKLPIRWADRRAGDSPAVIADSRKIQSLLSWKPRYDDLEWICKTALRWEEKLK